LNVKSYKETNQAFYTKQIQIVYSKNEWNAKYEDNAKKPRLRYWVIK